MDQFYMIVVAMAVVLLILCLTGVGILMGYQNANLTFPPSANTCPDGDGWTTVGTTCTVPTAYASSVSNTTVGYTPPAANAGNAGTINFANWAICDKKKWANKYNINWDGVSNYTKC